jgi:hypothetical protein
MEQVVLTDVTPARRHCGFLEEPGASDHVCWGSSAPSSTRTNRNPGIVGLSPDESVWRRGSCIALTGALATHTLRFDLAELAYKMDRFLLTTTVS